MLSQSISGGAFSASSVSSVLPDHATASAPGANASAIASRAPTDAQLNEEIQAYLHTHKDKLLEGLKKYKISPQFLYATLVSGLVAKQIVVPDMAKPAVNAYIANTIFAASGKITDFAIGKMTKDQLVGAINHIVGEGQIAVQGDRAGVMNVEEGRRALSRDQRNRILENWQDSSRLSLPQAVGLAVGGGTILALANTGAAALGGALKTALGITGASATAIKLGVTAMANMLSGPLLVDFNRHRLGLEQPPGSSMVLGGGWASLAVANSGVLPESPIENVLVSAIVAALTTAVLAYSRQPIMNGAHRALAGASAAYTAVSQSASHGFNHLTTHLGSRFRQAVSTEPRVSVPSISNAIHENDQEAMPMNGPFPLLHAGTMPTPFASFSGEDGSISVSSFVNVPIFSTRGLRLPSPDY